ncbi:rhamnan synthesis F family protein [Tepidamorphus sp. 3E244]|uniref:rhamnan synthesis F family protein n=1 Tax=Tepidamorphus sp. 3E244 TaxID=3385498 RepID=UPI0038FCB75F
MSSSTTEPDLQSQGEEPVGSFSRPKLCIFVHVHYLDVWDYIASTISDNVQTPFDLVVTTTQAAAQVTPPRSDNLQNFAVHEVENRGRDILPFLEALEMSQPFDIGLKLHTKKSTHRQDGAEWGRAMIGSLVGKRETVDEVMRAMQANPHVGMIPAEGMMLRLGYRVGANKPLMREILNALSIKLPAGAIREGWMAAGSMFWFRPQAISGLLTPETQEMFPPEQAQLDGTAAHAYERLFTLVGAKRGYTAFPIDRLEEFRDKSDQSLIDVRLEKTAVGGSPFVAEPVPAAAFLAKWVPAITEFYYGLPKPIRRYSDLWLKAR